MDNGDLIDALSLSPSSDINLSSEQANWAVYNDPTAIEPLPPANFDLGAALAGGYYTKGATEIINSPLDQPTVAETPTPSAQSPDLGKIISQVGGIGVSLANIFGKPKVAQIIGATVPGSNQTAVYGSPKVPQTGVMPITYGRAGALLSGSIAGIPMILIIGLVVLLLVMKK